MNDWNEREALKDKRNRKLKLPPSRGVLVLLLLQAHHSPSELSGIRVLRLRSLAKRQLNCFFPSAPLSTSPLIEKPSFVATTFPSSLNRTRRRHLGLSRMVRYEEQAEQRAGCGIGPTEANTFRVRVMSQVEQNLMGNIGIIMKSGGKNPRQWPARWCCSRARWPLLRWSRLGCGQLKRALCGDHNVRAVASVLVRWLFPKRAFFSLTFANLIAVYAAVLRSLWKVFGNVSSVAAGIGFSLPVAAFLCGCLIWRNQSAFWSTTRVYAIAIHFLARCLGFCHFGSWYRRTASFAAV